jgi:hypothetical protein
MMGHARYPTAIGVVCPPRTHCALRALRPLARGWGSSGSAASGPRAVHKDAQDLAQWHA